MAGSYDRNWGKSRGTRLPFKLEGLQPFKCTYPVHLTDMMDAGQSNQTGLQRTDFATSPFKENRTRAVREYEQTIDQLRKENFDLKMKMYLLEEESRKRLCGAACSQNKDAYNCVEVIVNLRVETENLRLETENLRLETENLRKELGDKDQEMKNALELAEKSAIELKEMQEKLTELDELKSLLEEIPTADEVNDIKNEFNEMKYQTESLNNLIAEKESEVQAAKIKLEELETRNNVLEDKVKKRNLAIEGFCEKHRRFLEDVPKNLRPIVKAAVDAARNNNETEIISSLENFKVSLCEMMPGPSKLQASGLFNKSKEDSQLQDSSRRLSSSKNSSESLKESQSSDVEPVHQDIHSSSSSSSSSEKLLKNVSSENLKNKISDNDVSSTSKMSSESYDDSNLDAITHLLNDNESLKQDNEEKTRVISQLNLMCSDFEKKEQELKYELKDASAKIQCLEIALEELKKQDENNLSKGDSSAQTDIQWHSLESKVSDKRVEEFGTSDNISELKEEILMLILAIEQKEKELSDSNQKLIFLQNDENKNVRDVSTLADEDFSNERNELQHRLAISCSVNNDLLKHLQSLERFMEDLLHQRNLSTSSLENTEETSDFFAQLSKCLDESLKLSHTLSDQLSICEGSKIFEPNETPVPQSEFDFSNLKSYEHMLDSRSSQDDSVFPSISEEGRNEFYLSNKKTNLFGRGRRRLSFSSIKRSSLDSLIENPENVVVLKTGNNEDLILLLNKNGVPEDVLIRNNHSNNDENANMFQNRSQCWNASMTSYLKNCEKIDLDRYKDSVYNNDTLNSIKPGYVRHNAWMSSDSDTWSEPDKNVSLQRIGIDVQTSPMSSRSPRKARFKDRRMADDSTKNESTSSYVKLQSFSRKRRSSDTSKMSFVCKRCQKQSNQIEDFSKEGSVGVSSQEAEYKSSFNMEHQNEIIKLQEILKNKEQLIESLIIEKNTLFNSVNDLKEELAELTKNNEMIISKNNSYLNEINDKDGANEDLKGIISSLEKQVSDSNNLCNDLQKELSQTKERLVFLDGKCSEYENKLSFCSNEKNSYKEKMKAMEEKENKLMEDIRELVSQKNSLLDKLKIEEERKGVFEKENSELEEKLEKSTKQISKLKTKIKELDNTKISLLESKDKTEKDLLSSNSLCERYSSEAKTLEEKVKKLKSNCELYEKEIDSLSNSKHEFIEKLLQIESYFISSLKMLSSVCGGTYQMDSLDYDKPSFDDARISHLVRRIEIESYKFKDFINDLNQQFQNMLAQLNESKSAVEGEKQRVIFFKEQLELREEEIKSLEKECIILQGELKSIVEKFKSEEEMQKTKISVLMEDLNNKASENQALIEDKNQLLKEIESSKKSILDLENYIKELKTSAKNSSSREEVNLKNSLLELKEKEAEIKSLSEANNQLLTGVKDLENKLVESEKSTKIANSKINSLQEQMTLLEKITEKDKLDLKSKDEEINGLQEHVLRIQSQVNELLTEKINFSRSSPSSVKKSVSDNPVSPDSSNIIEVCSDSFLLDHNKDSLGSSPHSFTSVPSSKSDKALSKSTGGKDLEEYLTIIRILQSKLEVAEKRIETLEKGSDDTVFKNSNISGKLDDSCVPIESSKSDQSLLTNLQKKDHEKYLKTVKTLQTKLEMSEKRIEILDKEKSSLRENLIAYMRSSKKAEEPAEDSLHKSEKLADLESKLEIKQAFIKELKSDLYKTHDSLIDKEKENDKLQKELSKYKKIADDNARYLNQNIPTSRLSDSFLLSTETNISDLRKQKRELINSLLSLQKQFYEAKNIHLRHFDKFNKHIESLRSLQVCPNLLKSESAPLLNSSLLSNIEQSRKWDRTLKNTQIDLEVDVECLQNFKIFLKRFFTPIMLQCNEDISSRKDPSNNASTNVLPKKIDAAIQTVDESFKVKEVFKSSSEKLSDNMVQVQLKEDPSLDRLAFMAAKISSKIDRIENVLKSILEEFNEIRDLELAINETSRKTAAKSLLLKLYEGIQSLKENCHEIFYLNSALKSLEIFGKNISQSLNKHDLSDQESLLSEETITLSRSGSLSPVSFEDHFQSTSIRHLLKAQDQIRSYEKHIQEEKRVSLKPSHKLISSSQDSVFQRSHYSSPDLGIESDPNHEHSAPEHIEQFHPLKTIPPRHELLGSTRLKNLDKQSLSSIYNLSNSCIKVPGENLALSISSTLHAIGLLQEYELLKKEVAESLVGIKSVLSRTGDGLQHIGSYTSTSPRKKLEYSTLKAIKDTCINIEVCLQKAHKLINNFWTAPCPSEEELRLLLQHNEELNGKMKKLFESKKKQENDFKDILERLKRAEITKEQQEQKISKKLVKTKRVLRQAEKKILETKNTELPMLAKCSSRMPTLKL